MKNTIYNEDCLKTMQKMPDNFLDLTVTSPPYDNLREYDGYSFNLESIIMELYRVTKEGHVVVWVVGDKTEKGGETGTSFRQALCFQDHGFKIHDTMIYHRSAMPNSSKRYSQDFEYMFIFVKNKIKTKVFARF